MILYSARQSTDLVRSVCATLRGGPRTSDGFARELHKREGTFRAMECETAPAWIRREGLRESAEDGDGRNGFWKHNERGQYESIVINSNFLVGSVHCGDSVRR